MLAPSASLASPTPSVTPTPTFDLFGAALLRPRQTDFDYGCYNYGPNVYACTTHLSDCYSDFDFMTAGGGPDAGIAYNSAVDSAVQSCVCTHGQAYLNCWYTRIATGTCSSLYDGWGEIQSSGYASICGTAFGVGGNKPQGQQQPDIPTSVSLALQTVNVVTVSTRINTPAYDGRPKFQGTGALLQEGCAQPSFTLVDAGNTAYYAGFLGCIKDRPDCCPWPVETAAAAVASAVSGSNAAELEKLGFDYPIPVDAKQARLQTCADDYYSISGGCCPNGFVPFTSAVGGQTPCWSSIKAGTTRAPTLTVERGKETKTDRETSAVINIVWSMRYPVADQSSGGLSTAAKAGIGAGAGVAVILIGGLAFCLWRQRKKNKQLKAQQPVDPNAAATTATAAQAVPQQQQMGQTLPQAFPSNQFQPIPGQQQPQGQFPPGPPGQFPNGYPSPNQYIAAAAIPHGSDPSRHSINTPISSPSALIPQNTGTSNTTNGHASELSSLSSGQNLLHNTQPHSTPSPGVGPGQGGYPAPIAEADEGQHQHHGQQNQFYGGAYQQQQQQQGQYYQQQQPQGQYYNQPPQQQYGAPYMQAGQQWQGQQQQHQYQNAAEMSAQREVDPPQEVMGSYPAAPPPLQNHNQPQGPPPAQ
ncbi:hypothetical protein QBC40DRAFT_73825 [Triangularia verruculosa]|uniref:Uncharacterized protein n=1 Tax=Triangularia verruculosa TaxID=2587418 RepID=A0AAN6XG79_9PEZI|nr:hypothetical protein QBC40DRAFT_73825 [Triangularia verruculosa]